MIFANDFKAGNGLGMKIVGGRTIPGTKTVGAYVAAIYQGGVAEQLLGELQEGTIIWHSSIMVVVIKCLDLSEEIMKRNCPWFEHWLFFTEHNDFLKNWLALLN